MIAEQPRTLFRVAGMISLFLVLSRLSGYIREALLAARFGASHTTDAYLVAQDIPASLFAAISAALVMVFIPVYREVLHRRGEPASWRVVSTVLNLTMLLSVAILILGGLLAPLGIPLLVPGLPVATQALTVTLTRTMLPMVLFMGMAGLAAAVLNANRHFTAPALLGLASNIVVISALLVVSSPNQIVQVAWAVVAGAALGALLQLPFLPQLGFRYHRHLDLKDPAILQIGRLILPILVTTTAIQAQNFVDRFLASGLAEGSISALNYAVRLSALPYGVVGIALPPSCIRT